ncbi:MAG: hypothetical protein JKX99_11800 [Robiginitomaculum sp.]|nr:hypothetical protein [Robiginitomaculum sp.]
MDASFEEKSTLISLVAIAVTFGNYFGRVWFFPRDEASQLGLLFTVLFIFIVIEALLHIGLAIGQKQQKADERDKAVSGKANRNGYLLMLSLLICFVGYLIFAGILTGTANVMTAINLMVFAVVAAELVRLGSLLFYYRMGA